ncbi:hypothetical protein BN1708_003670, partial [Verticillium longisporum]
VTPVIPRPVWPIRYAAPTSRLGLAVHSGEKGCRVSLPSTASISGAWLAVLMSKSESIAPARAPAQRMTKTEEGKG